jgi:tRNA pseudouridine38-40 synthase
MSRSFKITLAYDGTTFVGWQRQASGPSIQGALEQALLELDGHPVTVTGAGRTDAGVHALGQVAAFSVDRDLDAPTLVRALNARLPRTIRILAAAHVGPDFHPQFGARAKTYRYRLWNAEVLSPFEGPYVWHIRAPALDVEAMAAAARLIEGGHDFASFQASGGDVRTSEREVFSSRIVRDREERHDDSASLITYEIRGSGFLRHMVRNIVGTLVEIGRGRRRVEWVLEVLAAQDRTKAGPTAPPEGLFLVGVEYDPQL